VESFLQNFKGRGTVVQVKIVGNSSSIWTISPPSRDLMTKYLSDNNDNVTMRFSYEFTRWGLHSTFLHISVSFVRIRSQPLTVLMTFSSLCHFSCHLSIPSQLQLLFLLLLLHCAFLLSPCGLILLTHGPEVPFS